jgi:hypothetical protein
MRSSATSPAADTPTSSVRLQVESSAASPSWALRTSFASRSASCAGGTAQRSRTATGAVR